MVVDSADLFDAIYNGDLCAILFSDDRGHITQANNRCTKILGYPVDELLGRRVIEFVPEEDRPPLENCIYDLTEGAEASHNITHRFVRKDGEMCWITGSLSSFRTTDGAQMLESAFIDVTAEKEAEQRLRTSQDLLKSTIDSSDVQLFTYFPARHHLDIYLLNPHYSALTTSWDGYPDSFIEYTNMSDADAKSYRAMIRALDDGTADEVSCVTRMNYEGHWLWIEVHFTAVRDGDGTVVRAEGYATNVTDRKEAEDRRDRVLEIMTSMASKYDSFYLCDIEADTVHRINYNAKRRDLVSIPEDGVLSKTLSEFCAKGVGPDFQSIFNRFTSPEQIRIELPDGTNSFEFQYQESKAFKSRWKLGEVIAVSRDDDGMVMSYCLAVTDITDLKHREFDRMRRSQAQAALVNIAFDKTGVFDFTYDVQERAISCSERTQRACGCRERYENMPASFRDVFIHPDYHDVFNAMYERCNEGDDVSTAEFMDKAGVHWYRTALHVIERNDEGQPRLALGIVERVDELHAARSEAATMQQLFQYAVENRYEDLVFIDTNDRSYAFINAGHGIEDNWNGIETKGDFDEATRRLISDVAVDDEGRAALSTLALDKLVPTLKNDGRYSIRYKAKLEDGQIRWKLIDCMLFNNELDKILMLISDIQQEETVKDELREAREAADEANLAKSAFLANMSHEIRTPMNTIIGISEILMNKQLPLETLNEISTIQNAASGLLAIINDILDFSKIESGKFVINPVDYMLPSLLMDINNMISVRLADKPVDFIINLDHRLPNHLIGDDIRIEQILMNLLGNAVKFTKEGFIELRIEGEAVNETDYKLVFKVIDSGIGIKEEDIGKLFGSFTQVDTTKNRSITGSGLGLAISKSFAEMMGGGITVESIYGRGSTFTVEVMQKVKYYEPIGEVRSKNVRMLICESNEVIISSISRTLENLGVEFRVCRELDKIRSYHNMTHVLIQRSNFIQVKEKISFMFEPSNIFLILDNGEQASGDFMAYKQLQLPLLCLQIINALNGEQIANSYKRKNFDRSQIIPLTYAHVLVVDDNVTNLQVARGLMAPYQMRIDVATSGFKAIELAKSVKYDLIFMDHMMPEMDGLETTQHIRELPGDYYKKLPIVALTANAVSDARELFLANGLDDFLAKPIEMTELHRILKKYVQSKAPAGYMEDYFKKNGHKNTKPQPKQASSTVAAAMPSASSFAALPKLAGPLASTNDGSAVGQLLAQNNALLSQNMLLLQTLLGGAGAGSATGGAGIVGGPGASGMGSIGSGASGTGAGIGGSVKNTGIGAGTVLHQSSDPLTENGLSNDDQTTEVLPGSIPEVNMAKALETYGGSVKVYHGILETYLHDISDRLPKLRQIFESKDIGNFTISVHAIKSASREVGADALGELAYQLEKAGKKGDRAFIETHFEPFMDELENMRRNVDTYMRDYVQAGDDVTEREMRDAFPEDIVRALKEACENMDYTLAEEKLSDLDRYRYSEALSGVLSTMMRYCSEFEYEKLEDAVRTL